MKNMRSSSAYLLIPIFFLQLVKATVTDDCQNHVVPCIQMLKLQGHPRPSITSGLECVYFGKDQEGQLCKMKANGQVDLTCHANSEDYVMRVVYTNGYGDITIGDQSLFDWAWNLQGGSADKSTKLNDLLTVGCKEG